MKNIVEAQNTQLSQKTNMLGSQWSEIQRLQEDNQALRQQLESFGSEDKLQDLKMRMQCTEQDAQTLRNNAQAYGKKTALLKAQATALQIKLKEVTIENARLERACSAAQSKAEVSFCAQWLVACFTAL